MTGIGEYTLWWSGLYNFVFKIIPYLTRFFNADHDELINIYLHFLKKGARMFGPIITWDAKKIQNV